MKIERLKHVADIRVSNVDKKSADGDAQIRLCNYTDVYYNERITGALDFMTATATQDQRATFGLREGDVVLTKDSETADDIGVSALVAEDVPDLVCGYHLAVVRARAGRAVGGYLRWVIASVLARQQMSAAATGVTRFGLRSEAIADLSVPVPPIPIQGAIADYLDRETVRIDAFIAAKRRMVELLEERWQEVLDTAVWSDVVRTTRVMHVVDLRRQVMYGIVLPGPDVGGEGIAIVKGGDVAKGRLSWEALCKTTPEIEAPYARARVRGGDLVFAIRGGIGDVAIVPEELTGANLTQDVARVAPRTGISSQWLMYALQSPKCQHDVRRRVTGATITGLNIWELERVAIPLASADRQQRDLEQLTEEAEHLRAMGGALDRQVALLQEHRQALITAAVTGQLHIPEAA